MSPVAFDTSVLVAALQSWHADHARSASAVDRHLGRSEVVLPVHALLETFSVLTRVPKPLRITPEAALALLTCTLERCDVVGIEGAGALELLASFPARDVRGGAVYDAVIAAAAFAGGARTLVTLNGRHFARLAPEGLAVVEP